MPVRFNVHGPFDIPAERLPGGRLIDSDTAARFWATNPDVASLRGCYLFAMRAGNGIVPGYVGKATKTFEQECFTPDKVGKYLRFVCRYSKGTPVMFFIAPPNGRGRPNENAIEDCEAELIMLASRVSDHLVNVQGTGEPSFDIPHITVGARGRPSTGTIALLHALRLDEPVERAKREVSAPEFTPATDEGATSDEPDPLIAQIN